MKHLLKVLLASSALLAVNSCFAETVYVNGKAVSPEIINQAISQFEKSSPMAAAQMHNPAFKKEILQSIGMQQAILMKGNGMGLDKTPAYQEKLEQVKPMIYAQILQDDANKAPVTEAEERAKYNQMVANAATQKEYDVSHILVSNLDTAKMIEGKLQDGANFAALAKQYSTDPGTKSNGGNLGWSSASNFVPQFAQAVRELKPGSYTTTPVKTQFGYHIIKLNNVRSGNKNVPAFSKLEPQLKQEIRMDRTRAFFDNIKSQYQITVK